jgi:hypothetical protein
MTRQCSTTPWERESAAQALERHVGGRRDIVIGVECPTMRELISLLRSEKASICAWLQDVDGNYHTGCGHTFFFDTGTAQENGAKFCQYCGKGMQATEYKDKEIDV